MKTRVSRASCRFQLRLFAYASSYYIDRITRLEAVLARKPRVLEIDMVGVGEIPADLALLMRSVLLDRSPKTRVITNARSSLHGAAVMVWLLGDTRWLREDATLFFRRANLPEVEQPEPNAVWKDEEPTFCDSSSEIEPEEGDYARVLQVINEFLPVKELTGKFIGLPILRQFGLVDNEKVDTFLAAVLGKKVEPTDNVSEELEKKRTRGKVKASRSQPAKQ